MRKKIRKITQKRKTLKIQAKKYSARKITSKKITPKKRSVPNKGSKKIIKKGKVKRPVKRHTSTSSVQKKTPKKTRLIKEKTSAFSPSHTITPGTVSSGPANIKPYHFKKNEDYMNEKQLSHFRTALSQWKHQLMAEVDRTVQNMQGGIVNYPDPVDRASQEEEFSLELRTRDRERKLLRKIEETLNRINDSDYGYCDDCGAEIGIRRLEARPTATQCIECKTIAEIKEKQVGEGI